MSYITNYLVEVIKMSQKLKCQICEYTESVPMHCGQLMHIENFDGEAKLACWMGPECGVQDIPTHHDKFMQMKIIE
jgi:hypothetical protein